MSDTDKKDTLKFPPYIHVLIPKDHDETKIDGGDQWLGVLDAIKGEIGAAEESLHKEISAVETKISEQGKKIKALGSMMGEVEASITKNMDARITLVQTKISTVEEALNKKMDEILSILKSSSRT